MEETSEPIHIEDIGDTPLNESEDQIQTWFLSRTLNPRQTDSILYHCRDMITGKEQISRELWKKQPVDKNLNLNWKTDVYESVKSMKRKYKNST